MWESTDATSFAKLLKELSALIKSQCFYILIHQCDCFTINNYICQSVQQSTVSMGVDAYPTNWTRFLYHWYICYCLCHRCYVCLLCMTINFFIANMHKINERFLSCFNVVQCRKIHLSIKFCSKWMNLVINQWILGDCIIGCRQASLSWRKSSKDGVFYILCNFYAKIQCLPARWSHGDWWCARVLRACSPTLRNYFYF